MTHYFRIPFVLNAALGPCDLQLRTLVDDGAVFYLNGREVHRQSMPEGEVRYATPAISVTDPPITGPISISATNVVVGTNWLAVEVHQWDATSSDIVCGAELSLCEPVKTGIPATPFTENEEQWIELYNRSSRAVDLSGWQHIIQP